MAGDMELSELPATAEWSLCRGEGMFNFYFPTAKDKELFDPFATAKQSAAKEWFSIQAYSSPGHGVAQDRTFISGQMSTTWSLTSLTQATLKLWCRMSPSALRCNAQNPHRLGSYFDPPRRKQAPIQTYRPHIGFPYEPFSKKCKTNPWYILIHIKNLA